MITLAICLIYYGIAIWLYQMYLWMSEGQWVSIPAMLAWRVVFDAPPAQQWVIGAVARWVLDWPLSLVFVSLGLCILGLVYGIRRLRRVWHRRRHQRQLAEQCAQAGYKPWTVPKVLANLDAPPPLNTTAGQRRFG